MLTRPVFLLVSELSLFRSYFARNWPLLSQGHGFVALALAMIVLGVNMLANLNKERASQEALGLSFWRVVIASGIIVFVLGFINLVAVRLPTRWFHPGLTRSRATSFVIVRKESQPARSAQKVPWPFAGGV